MNELEEQIMQYEKDSIAYETGRSKVEPNNAMLISPNELLILLNEKNTENNKLCNFLAERYESYLKVCAALASKTEAVEEAKPIVRHSANGENCWAEALTWWKKYGGTK